MQILEMEQLRREAEEEARRRAKVKHGSCLEHTKAVGFDRRIAIFCYKVVQKTHRLSNCRP